MTKQAVTKEALIAVLARGVLEAGITEETAWTLGVDANDEEASAKAGELVEALCRELIAENS